MNNYDSYAKKTSKILEAISNLNHPNAFTECLSIFIEQNPWKLQEFLCGKDGWSGNGKYDMTIFIVLPNHFDPFYKDLTATVKKLSRYQYKKLCEAVDLKHDFFSYRKGLLLETFYAIDSFLNALNEHTIAVYEQDCIAQFNNTLTRRIEEWHNISSKELDIVSSALAATISTTTIDSIVARLMTLIGHWLNNLEIRNHRELARNGYNGYGTQCCRCADKIYPFACESPYKLWDFNPFTLYEFEGGRV